MNDFETKVITEKSQIQDKIAEAERRSREWEEKQVELWPSTEEDMQACVQIMMMGFAMGGGPQPAVREINGQRVYAPWVAQVKDYCLKQHGHGAFGGTVHQYVGRLMEKPRPLCSGPPFKLILYLLAAGAR